MVDLGSELRNAAYTGARPEIIERVAADRRNILDIGCSTGAIGHAIKVRDRAITVSGVEGNPDTAAVAQDVLDEVVVGDIDDWDTIASRLTKAPFDCIVCADVLEHTRDPWRVLPKIAALLAPGGYLVVSLPNVGHYDTLINVFMRRRFPRRDRGLHDETHLRWFARHDVADLIDTTGLNIASWYRVMRLVERPARKNRLAKYVAVPGLRDLLTFQYVIVTKPKAKI
jgi:2-polyprenyl-3-methyl-5-hydroxy-6-metoxy-1,4-benzoquinol methylase